jgi:large subunit ribosomal protein L15
MELHNLKPAKGSTHKSKRLGRGQGSGYGGTSTKGNKGAQSRSGYSRKIGHEGGQQPLQRRVPKFGFINPFRVEYKPVNIGLLEQIAIEKKVKVFDQKFLIELGLVNKNDLIKILADGELKQSLEITAHSFSKKAQELIEKAGGKANRIEKAGRKPEETEKTTEKAAPKAEKEEVTAKKIEKPVEKSEKPVAKIEKEIKPLKKEEKKANPQKAEEKKEKPEEIKKPEENKDNSEEAK